MILRKGRTPKTPKTPARRQGSGKEVINTQSESNQIMRDIGPKAKVCHMTTLGQFFVAGEGSRSM